MLRFHKFDEAPASCQFGPTGTSHCGDTVRSACLTNRRSTMSRPGIARGVSGQRCILFQRVLQDCRVDRDHFDSTARRSRWHKNHGRDPAIDREGQAFDQLFVGFHAILTGWKRVIDTLQHETAAEPDRLFACARDHRRPIPNASDRNISPSPSTQGHAARPGAAWVRFTKAYFRLLSMLAQACATAEFAASLPGSVAQPPFSMNELCWYELTFLSSAMFATASALRWNLSTQIGERAATTAAVELFCVMSFAVPPVTQPPQLNPISKVAAAPTAAPCSSRVSESP